MADPAEAEAAAAAADTISGGDIDELVSMGLGRLQDEPARLRSEADTLHQALQTLTLDNYSVFIENQDCVRHLKGCTSSMKEDLQVLMKELRGMQDTLESIGEAASQQQVLHHRNRQTLAHHSQLVDLLEVPQLMDACVRNNMFEDALSIATFAHGLLRRHKGGGDSQGAPRVVQLIFEETCGSLHTLRDRMLLELRGDIQLASCLRVVSCLRRLELLLAEPDQRDLVELQLQVEFIEARDAWLQSFLDEAQAGRSPLKNPYPVLVDIIERCRTSWFEISTQFRAIFGSGGSGTGGVEDEAKEDMSEMVITSWMDRRIELFLSHLRALLPLIDDGAALQNLLEQSMFFGASMARLGCDFRGLLVPVFEETIWGMVTLRWAGACNGFIQGLSSLQEELSTARVAVAVPLHLQRSAGRADRSVPSSTSAGGRPPPIELLDFPLIARFTNEILASFNVLRECAPLSLELRLRVALVSCFTEVFNALAAHKRSLLGLETNDKATAERTRIASEGVATASQALDSLVVPHIACCLSTLFPEGEASQQAPLTEMLSKVLVDLGLRVTPKSKTSSSSTANTGSSSSSSGGGGGGGGAPTSISSPPPPPT